VKVLTSGAFAAGGQPISDLGTGLEQFIAIVSVVLALLLALVTLGPWLIRYLPWRWERLRRVRAAHRAIRRAPDSDAGIERTLAMRAMAPARLRHVARLHAGPARRLDVRAPRPARSAELASVGLRP
jgi:hypothetical protein